MQIVLGLSLTGYLLPWDQKGFWATRVATNLMGLVPVVGEQLQQLVVGGPTYGHATLTRFFALHAGVLARACSIAFLVLHVYLFRRHGLCAKQPATQADCEFWPDQVLKDAVACLAVLCVVLGLVIIPPFLHQQTGDPGVTFYIGAELGAPADPADQYSAARPEWYFLFLFQTAEVLSRLVRSGRCPGRAGAGDARFGRDAAGWPLEAGPSLQCRFSAGADRRRGPADHSRLVGRSLRARAQPTICRPWPMPTAIPNARPNWPPVAFRPKGPSRWSAAIPKFKAANSLPPSVRSATTIASEPSSADAANPKSEPPRDGAPHLAGFASREWLAGLLDPKRVDGPDYFGPTSHHDGQMVDFVKKTLPEWKPTEIENAIIALSAEAHLPEQAEIDARDKDRIAAGVALIKDEERCGGCHKFHDAGQGDGGSRSDRLRFARVAVGLHRQSGGRSFLRQAERPHAGICSA